MSVSVRHVAILSLVALLPAGIFAANRGELLIGIAMINIAIIAASLYVAVSPIEESTPGVSG